MAHALDTKCLEERKWWCFFLSSIVTFITGAASVLIVRAFNSVLRKKVGNTFFFHFQSDIFGWEESMNMEKGGRTVAFWLVAPTVSRLALMFLFLRNKLEKGTRMHR